MIFTRRVFTGTLLLLPGLLAAETLVQWGELGGVTPGNTNIVTANQNFIGTSSTYTGATNNPAVGAAYYPEATGRSPWFSAASSVIGARIVEHASSGDRLTMYASTAAGATFRGMYMWVSNYFLAVSQPFVATNVLLVMNQRSNANTTDQSVRVVAQQNDQYFITDGRPFSANATTSSYDLATETWYSFSPFSSGSESIGGVVAGPSLTNLQAIGCYFTTLNGGGAAANTGAQLWHFRVNGAPVESGPVFYTLTAAPQNPTWGSVTPTSGVHTAGSVVAVTATASNYFYFSNWSGGLSGVANPTNVTVNNHLAITGVFAERLATNQTPQWWLASFGLTPDDDGALSDLDLDGVPAWQEYRAGTDPDVSNSFAAASVRNIPLVDFGAKVGSGYYRGQSAPRSYTPLVDRDNNGTLTNDTVRAWIFSTNVPLNAPGLEFDTNSPSGVFYGGLTSFAVDNPNRTLSEGMVNSNHEYYDDLNLMGLGNIIPGELVEAYGVWYWRKEDFLNGANEHPIRFDSNSTISVYISRYWGGVNAGRWLVREGDQFYLSRATFAGKTNQYDMTTTNRVEDPGDGANNPLIRATHTLNPLTTLWAPYNPGAAPGTNDDFDIAFQADTSSFSTVAFSNVTAVGFFVERKLSPPVVVAPGLLTNQPMGVKWNAFRCNAIVERPDTASYHQPTAPLNNGELHLASNQVSYALWRKVFRHTQRRPYMHDLGNRTYSYERDGAMGSMRADDLAHDGLEPVRDITWLDAIAFCNGLSELEGLEPCYYSDSAMTNVLRVIVARDFIEDWNNRPTVYWKTSSPGFRLPTPGEWEQMTAGLRDTSSWEYVWHPTASIANASVQTTRSVRAWGLVSPTTSVLRFTERPWSGSPRIGFRIARNGSAGPAFPTTSGISTSWTFSADTALAPSTPLLDAQVRGLAESWYSFVAMTVSLVHAASPVDTNFIPSATFPDAPLPADFGATEIPFRLWNLVQGWARDRGYSFNYDGDMGSMGNAPSSVAHTNTEPVTEISLQDTYVWCNAFSELMGRTPVYYLDAAFTQPCRTASLFRLETIVRDTGVNWPGGSVTPYDTAALLPVWQNAEANGFRIPLPQEWNLANATNANSATDAYNWLLTNSAGKTQPVGTKLPNPLGIHDMEGNVLEFTWGSQKANINNAPFRMGSHFARASLIGKNPAHGAEFHAVGRNHVGFRILSLPAPPAQDFPLAVRSSNPSWGVATPNRRPVRGGRAGFRDGRRGRLLPLHRLDRRCQQYHEPAATHRDQPYVALGRLRREPRPARGAALVAFPSGGWEPTTPMRSGTRTAIASQRGRNSSRTHIRPMASHSFTLRTAGPRRPGPFSGGRSPRTVSMRFTGPPT
jgi:formylglycine-generating enzyme required for sulfatase activity